MKIDNGIPARSGAMIPLRILFQEMFFVFMLFPMFTILIYAKGCDMSSTLSQTYEGLAERDQINIQAANEGEDSSNLSSNRSKDWRGADQKMRS